MLTLDIRPVLHSHTQHAETCKYASLRSFPCPCFIALHISVSFSNRQYVSTSKQEPSTSMPPHTKELGAVRISRAKMQRLWCCWSEAVPPHKADAICHCWLRLHNFQSYICPSLMTWFPNIHGLWTQKLRVTVLDARMNLNCQEVDSWLRHSYMWT